MTNTIFEKLPLTEKTSWLFFKDNLNINNEDKVNDITKVDIITERTKVERNQYCQ